MKYPTIKIAGRMLREVSPRALAKAVRFGFRGVHAVRRFDRRIQRGDQFPAFMMISVTNRCNLKCQGCWVTPTPPTDMTPESLRQIITECQGQGSRFFGILGGEPLLHDGLLDVLEAFPKAYFQLFTNGHFLDAKIAGRLRRMGNVTPLISIEGLEDVADERRGGSDVAAHSLAAIECCRAEKLMIGVATSVCQSNFDQVVRPDFINDMVSRGVHYVWYYIYRPVGPDPTPELALDPEKVYQLRKFLVDARDWAPAIIVDAYWDANGNALCPAAMGISYHITPAGRIEPCPVIQCSCDRMTDDASLVQTVEQSDYLRRFRSFAADRTRACILLEDPAALRQFAKEAGAGDSSGRQGVYAEMAAMKPRPSHDMGDRRIPERNRFYRFAKKHWFFGFGAYG